MYNPEFAKAMYQARLEEVNKMLFLKVRPIKTPSRNVLSPFKAFRNLFTKETYHETKHPSPSA